jgi:hypothetical protein
MPPRFTIGLLVAVLLCACTIQTGTAAHGEPVNGGTEAQQGEVRDAARAVSKLLDAGKYADVWALAGPTLSASSNKEAFVSFLTGIRSRLGAPGKRIVKGFGFPTELEGAPKGQYGLVAVTTDFANADDVEERFVFELVDGNWRLAGYHVSKTMTFGNP